MTTHGGSPAVATPTPVPGHLSGPAGQSHAPRSAASASASGSGSGSGSSSSLSGTSSGSTSSESHPGSGAVGAASAPAHAGPGPSTSGQAAPTANNANNANTTSVDPAADPTAAPASASAPTPTDPSKPELPWAFIDCPAETLVILIAHMLDLLCQHNDQVVLTPDALTRFHSRAPPGITVIDYLRRIVKYTNLERIPLLSLLAYIDLTCQNLPTFTLSSLTVHRFLIAGVTAGSKAQCDVFCTNAHYAKVGGIKVQELNSLEREFLRVTGWALCCNADLLQRYYTSLIRSHGGYTQAAEPAESPFMAFPRAGLPADSVPATPQGDQVMGSGSEYASGDEAEAEGEAEGEVDDAVEDDGMDADSKGDEGGAAPGQGGPYSDGPGGSEPESRHHTDRSRTRDAMEVDPPEPKRQSSTSLKTLVGIFRRDREPSGSSTGPTASTGAKHGSGPVSAPGSAGSAPARTAGAPGAPGQAHDRDVSSTPVTPAARDADRSLRPDTGDRGRSRGADHEPSPKLTPRIRTRDERSVDGVRLGSGLGGVGVGVGVGAGVPADEGKRRARVE